MNLPKYSRSARLAKEWFQMSYKNGCTEAAEKDLHDFKEEMARIKAMSMSEPAVLLVIEVEPAVLMVIVKRDEVEPQKNSSFLKFLFHPLLE